MVLLFRNGDDGESGWSDPSIHHFFRRPVSAPINLNASSISSNSLIFSYLSTTYPEVTYTITSSTQVINVNTDKTVVSLTGLLPGKSYVFNVIAKSLRNKTTATSLPSITYTTLPIAPTITTVSITGQTTAIIGFTSTNGSDTTYSVTTTPTTSTFNGISPINITGLSAGVSYTFTVKATTTTGNASVTSGSYITRPSAPTITDVLITGPTTATVSFTSTNGAGTTYSVTTSPGTTTTTGTSPINISGLTGSTSYTFTLTATNTSGSTSVTSGSYTTQAAGPSTTTFTKGATLILPNPKFSSSNLPNNSNCITAASFSDDMQIILYVMGNAAVYPTFYLSTNKGVSFTNINSKLPNLNSVYTSVNRKGLCFGLGVSPDGTLIIIGLMFDSTGKTPCFYVLNDSSRSFTGTFNKYTGSLNTNGLFVPQPGKAIITNDNQWCYLLSNGGVYGSTAFRNTNAGDFTSWTGYNQTKYNLPSLSTSVISINSSANIIYAVSTNGGSAGLTYSNNYGATLSYKGPPNTNTLRFSSIACSSDGNIVYTTTITSSGLTNFYKSTNGGTSWSSLLMPNTGTASANMMVSSMVCDSTGTNVIMTLNGTINGVKNIGWRPNGINPTTTNAIYLSTNGGTSWSGIKMPAVFNPMGIASIRANSTFTKFIVLTNNNPTNMPNTGPYAGGFGNIYFFET